ncbi:MAG TPA: hypothetical protein ENJ82_08135 [Bacteroidetes bacterium]|nr:hypothetical protein [Bacteroidota bacterium]
MKKRTSTLAGGLIALFCTLQLFSCKVEPVPIQYGKDACHFCKMNIVDKQHAAELVTQKGKVYKFDAVECLLNDLKTRETQTIGLVLVNTYDEPINLYPAETATFLISEGVPSPMGANLTAFKERDNAIQTMMEKFGEIFSWEQLKEEFSVK